MVESLGVMCGLPLYDRISSIVCSEGIDVSRGKHVVAMGGQEAGTSNSDQRVRTDVFSLGLSPLEQSYEIDPHAEMHGVAFGTGLRRFLHRQTRMPRAVLSINKATIPKDVTPYELDRQLQLLCRIDHPNILPFRECCEDRHRIYLVYEWCDGGPLLHQLWRHEGMLSEYHVAQIIRELLSALVSAAQFGVHHLDLGLFSLFLEYAEQLSPIKVFGFGLAGYVMPTVTQRKVSRTNKHYYCSPELFNASLKSMSPQTRHSSDLWSVATILYTFCSGRPPFVGSSMKEVAAQVTKRKWSFGVEFDDYSPGLKDFLESVLKTDWKKRPTGIQVLSHTWVESTQDRVKDRRMNRLAMQQLQNYAQADHIKQTIARMLTDIGLTIDAYKGLEHKFREMDLNGDGTITANEIVQGASTLGLSAAEMDSIVQKLDRNGNCNVDISEFISALVMEQEEADEELIRKAFMKMDKDGDARVTKKELCGILRQYSGSIEASEVSAFIAKVDDDGDEKMDYREFSLLFPKVRGRFEDTSKKLNFASRTINCASKQLLEFEKTLKPWLRRVEALRDKIEIAVGKREAPENLVAGSNYSYEKGHLSEFDCQSMIRVFVSTLQDVPGHEMSANKNRRRQQATNESNDKKQAMQAKVKEADRGDGVQLIGMGMLAGHAKSTSAGRLRKRRVDPDFEMVSDSSGPESNENARMPGRPSAVLEWERKYEEDIREKRKEKNYNQDMYMFHSLFWLVKVKGVCQWTPPLLDALKEMRHACVSRVVEITIQSKLDLTKFRNALDESYTIRQDVQGEHMTKPMKWGSKLLPLGGMEGKSLKQKHHLDKIELIPLPTTLFFALPNDDVTQQKIAHMHAEHMQKLIFAADFANYILQDIKSLFEGVRQDILMSTSMENSIPYPPPLSHLFLKHCKGRELDLDARTPREGDAEDFDDDRTTMGNADGVRKEKKIERNQILTQLAQEQRKLASHNQHHRG